MKNMNEIKFIGRLGKDPEVRYTKTGKAVATFSVAVPRDYAPQGQEPITDFFNIVAWGILAEFCGNNLAKGLRVFVLGRVQNRSYDDKNGQKRWTTEVTAEFVAVSMESDKGLNGGTPGKPVDFGQFGKDVINEEIPF